MVNNGQITVTNANVSFLGSYLENGSLVSDPSQLHFQDLVVGETGYLVAGSGDAFFVSGDFVNNSLQGASWNTSNASLHFDGTGLTRFYLAGSDAGPNIRGTPAAFSWGELVLSSGASLELLDAANPTGAALHVGLLSLSDGVAQLSSVTGSARAYYDSSLAGNAYLGGQCYALGGGGMLIAAAVPEPESWALLLAGLGLVGGVARTRRSRSSSPAWAWCSWGARRISWWSRSGQKRSSSGPWQ